MLAFEVNEMNQTSHNIRNIYVTGCLVRAVPVPAVAPYATVSPIGAWGLKVQSDSGK